MIDSVMGEGASLSPMVRLGTLPLRLLAIERGAQLVFTEEIVADKLAVATREYDRRLGTTDWCSATGASLLRTCEAERGRLVVQIGVADVVTALAAAKSLIDPNDPSRDGIVGLDINMGCAKRNTTEHGAGFALFCDPGRSQAVVRALRAFVPPQIRISCKVRLCDAGADATSARCLGLVAAGASAISIHARRAHEKARDLARWGEVAMVVQQLRGKAHVLVNGDALDATAVEELRKASPLSSNPHLGLCRTITSP